LVVLQANHGFESESVIYLKVRLLKKLRALDAVRIIEGKL